MTAEAERESEDPFIGRVLENRYRIVEKLGEGGMGAVYEAEQLALNRRVALKVIHSTFSGDGEVRARFAREATASGQLDGHPHVASALDFGTLPDGSLFLVMQLVRGPSLRDVIDQGRLPWERALAIGTQIADALSAAHSRGIVHRDLKPDNVSLVRREDGREVAKVLDFGIARVMDANVSAISDTKLTRVGTIMGTPGYMSPEQAVGDRVDERADLYALGVVFFEMLTGRLPFDGPDLRSIVARQFAEDAPVPSVEAADPSIPPDLDTIVLALLSRAPEDRPSNATDLLRRLESLARASSIPEAAMPPLERGSSRATPSQLTRPSIDDLPGRASRAIDTVRTSVAAVLPPKAKPHALAIIAAAIGIPLLVIIFAVATSGPDEPETNPLVVVATPVIPGRPTPVLSAELTAAVETLVQSEDKAARGRAAEAVTAAAGDPAMPPYAVQLAALESARNCRQKETAVAALVELRDPRAVPPLERIAQSPRRGCGFLSTRDCHACIRSEVDAALTSLRAP